MVVALLELEVLAAEDSVDPEVSVPPFKGSNCRANETLAAVTKKNGRRRPFLTNRDVGLEDIYLCRVFVVVIVQWAQAARWLRSDRPRRLRVPNFVKSD